ncbi:MAG: polysaccharide biosynthesis C-terminal domain-containing protein [candidate division NC10 bacterium]|nr:polysaccharide biosynthesis C-terminal domain-containing protein [candidate division NC10 bacterium]
MSVKELNGTWLDFLSLSGVQLLLMPLGVLSASLAARLLGPEGYGVLALAVSVAQLAFLFGINWTSNALVRFGREELLQEGSIRKTFFARSLLLLLCWTLSVIALTLIRGPAARYIGIPERDLWTIHAMIFVIALSNHTLLILQALGRIRRYALTSLFERIFYIGLLVLYALLRPSVNARMVILAILFSKAFQVFLGASGLKVRDILPISLDRSILQRILSYSWPLIFAFSAGYVVDWIDLYVIRSYLPFREVGTYQIAYQGMLAFSGLLMVLSTLTFPIMTTLRVQDRQDLVQRYITQLTPQVTFTWSLLLALLSALSPPLFTLLFGHDFAGAVLPFKILLVGIAFQSVSVMYTPILASYDLTKQSTGINILMALVNLLGDLLLVPRFGIAGAAVATSFSYALSSTLYLVVGNRRLSMRGSRALLSPLLTLLVLGANLSPDSVAFGAATLIGTMILALLFARWSRLFSRKDVEVLEQIEMPILLKQGIRHVILALAR